MTDQTSEAASFCFCGHSSESHDDADGGWCEGCDFDSDSDLGTASHVFDHSEEADHDAGLHNREAMPGCPTCAAVVRGDSPVASSPFMPEGHVECPNCHGYGSSLREDADRCSRCGGSGTIPAPKPPPHGAAHRAAERQPYIPGALTNPRRHAPNDPDSHDPRTRYDDRTPAAVSAGLTPGWTCAECEPGRTA